MKFLLILLMTSICFGKDFKSMGQELEFNYLDIDESSQVWGIDFIDTNNFLYTTQKGKIFSYDLKNKLKKEIKHNLNNIKSKGQGGLLDIKVDKDQVYVTFSLKEGDKTRTALAKAKLTSNELNFDIILKTKTLSTNSHQYGSRILIEKDSLYMTVGERGEINKAQDKNFHNGKVLKLTLNGEPFEDKKSDGIFTLGHRNPQGITSYEGKVYVGEFGPQGGDEINVLRQGNNYGWPKVTFGEEYGGGNIGKNSGFTMPLVHWKPSISFSGINVYTGKKIAKWKGHLFLACLATAQLRRVNLNDTKDQESLLKDLGERFRMVRMSPDERLFLTFDSGKIGYITSKK